jgi:hypothetical protein
MQFRFTSAVICLALLGISGRANADCPASPSAPEIAQPLRDGATAVTGSGPALEAGCTATFQVHDTENAAAGAPGALLSIKSGATITANNDGTFSIPLAEPLREGEVITVTESLSGRAGAAPSSQTSVPVAVVVTGDWGRVKAYFVSGILISQNQNSFSQSSLYLEFNLDKTWRLPGYYHQDDSGKWSRWPGLNTFFDVRLTSIPVTACATSTPSSGTSGGNQQSSCTTSANGNAATPLNTFISSQKTARLATGIYFPWTITGWTYKNNPQALFIAPLAKVGFDTPAGSLSQVQPAATTNTSTTVSNSGDVVAVNPTNFYTFYGWGGRIGHYALTSHTDRSTAPELISYLDVVVGRFSNLETLVQPNGLNIPPTVRQRLLRIQVEGLLKVPSTPLFVGMSANVGQESVSVGKGSIVQRAGDDLRFLFGVRFDVAKLLSKVTATAP